MSGSENRSWIENEIGSAYRNLSMAGPMCECGLQFICISNIAKGDIGKGRKRDDSPSNELVMMPPSKKAIP